MKLMITLGIFIFSSLGGWLGSLMGGGAFGTWSLILSVVGSFFGIWAGYWVGKNYL
jgi:hypothetical protein